MQQIADTNILSELARPAPNAGVLTWAGKVTGPLTVSAVTVEEIEFGLSWKPNAAIQGWFRQFLADRCEVLPVTDEIAAWSGRMRGRLQAGGRTHTMADMLVAATAAVHNLTLITRNERDFIGCGIGILNPFT